MSGKYSSNRVLVSLLLIIIVLNLAHLGLSGFYSVSLRKPYGQTVKTANALDGQNGSVSDINAFDAKHMLQAIARNGRAAFVRDLQEHLEKEKTTGRQGARAVPMPAPEILDTTTWRIQRKEILFDGFSRFGEGTPLDRVELTDQEKNQLILSVNAFGAWETLSRQARDELLDQAKSSFVNTIVKYLTTSLTRRYIEANRTFFLEYFARILQANSGNNRNNNDTRSGPSGLGE